MRANQATLSLYPAVSNVLGRWRYGFLLESLVAREIRVRYRRSVLGVIWTLLNPLLMMVVFTVIFSTLFARSLTNFAVYYLSAQVAWQFFSQTSSQGMTSMLRNSSLYKRIYVPKYVFVLATVGAGLINLLLAFIPMTGIILLMRHPITPAVLFVPVGLVTLTAFTIGVSFIVATVTVFFDDLTQFYGVLLQILMYMCALFYPLSIVPQPWQTLIKLNPLYSLVQMIRVPIYNGTLPSYGIMLASTVSAVGALAIGLYLFTRNSDRFIYYV